MEANKVRLTREVRDQRIAIARDVQKQIVGRKYDFRPANGYIAQNYYDYKLFTDDDLGDDMREHVDKIADKCSVCLLGGMLLSTASLYDNIPLADYASDEFMGVSREQIGRSLAPFFDYDELIAMEAAFELYDYKSGGDFGGKACFYYKIPGSEVVLRPSETRVWAVMQNIIDNDGGLDLTQEPGIVAAA